MKRTQSLTTSPVTPAGLHLHGRVLYLLYRPASGGTTFHVDVETQARMVHRITFSTLFKEPKLQGHSVLYPLRYVIP